MGRGSHGVFHVELIKCNSYKVLRWLSKAGESESNMDKVFTNSIFFQLGRGQGYFCGKIYEWMMTLLSPSLQDCSVAPCKGFFDNQCYSYWAGKWFGYGL